VQVARLIHNILQAIKGQLTPELKSAIIPVAYIEGHQFKVLQAQQRLSNQATQQNMTEQKKKLARKRS